MERMNYTSKKIWLINFPVMMSILIEQVINITDALFLGYVGEVELGAAALAGIWFLTVYMLGFGFSLGLQVVIAEQNGKQNHTEIGEVFFQGLFFLSGMAIVLCVLSKLLSPLVLKCLITSTEVYKAVMDYLDWRIWGLLFSFPFLAFRSFWVGITQTRVLTISAITAILINIPGNYLFTFIMDMGISGTALSSSLAELFSLAVLLSATHYRLDREYYGLHCRFNVRILKSVFSVSVWSMLHAFISVAPWFLFFLAVEHLGELELAIANIVRSISSLFFVIVTSFAATTVALVGNLVGANEQNKIFGLCKRIIGLGYGIGFPLVFLALLFDQSVISVYTNHDVLVQKARPPLVVMLLNYVFALPGYVFVNAVTGTGATRLAFVFQLITILFYLVYLWCMSYWAVPLAVYWTAEYLFVILLAIQSIIYLKINEIKNRI